MRIHLDVHRRTGCGARCRSRPPTLVIAMAAPPNEFAFDSRIADAALENWRRRAAERETLARLPEKKYTANETPERLAKRANRLLDKVRAATPATSHRLSPQLRDLIQRSRVRPDEVTEHLMERIIGETRDFLSVSFLDRGIEAMRSVGRIVVRLGGGRSSYGSGFMVSPHLLLTNHHVLPSEEVAASAAVEFDYQLDRQGKPLQVHRYALEPRRFFLNDGKLDFALVAVAGTSDGGRPLADYDYCPLVAEEGKIVVNDCVNIIQHPRGEMKQVVIRENRLVDVLDLYLHYEGDTDPGSSGSAVFNDQWELVALHHSAVPAIDAQGRYLDIDGGEWRDGDDPTRLKWIANEGVRVSRVVAAIRDAAVREHEQELRDELLRLGGPPHESFRENGRHHGEHPHAPRVARGGDASPPAAWTGRVELGAAAAGSVTFTVPLTLTVALGTPLGGTGNGGVPGGGGPAATENTPPEPDYSNRRGYDPRFTGFAAPLPTLSNSLKRHAVTVPGASRDNPYELKYHNFSVMMNGTRRLAFVSAVNLDGRAPYTTKRTGGDEWFFDPRISDRVQAGPELYTGNPLDRGHLTRRADAAWGATEAQAEAANSDTFHWTNCSPQHEVFNQGQKAAGKGLRLWGNLEDHVAEHARGQRLSVMNGPVFRGNDREYRGIKLPREFWKVVVFTRDDGAPGAVAFKLSQAELIDNLPREAFEPGEFQAVQVRIRDLESATGLNFGELRSHDPLESTRNESFMDEGSDHVRIRSLRDVVL
jgi:endonuclease G